MNSCRLEPNDIKVLIAIYAEYMTRFGQIIPATRATSFVFRNSIERRVHCTKIAMTHSLERLNWLSYVNSDNYHHIKLLVAGRKLVEAAKEQWTEWTS